MPMKPAASKKSSNPKTTKGRPQKGNDHDLPRAHRGDTPEAKAQRKNTPKTHPTRSERAARKR